MRNFKILPAKVQVIRTIRKTYKTPDKKIITGKLLEQLLPKSIATSSLIAHIITCKYVDCLPLYRQETIFKRIHADLNRKTMARWLIKVSGKLSPLYNLLQDFLLERKYLHMDETYTQVLKEKGKKGVRLIDKLYKIEKRTKNISLETRDKIRKKEALPLLEEIKNWIDELRPKITPRSIAGKAINYAYNEWKYFKSYVDDPEYNISNILVENAIRPFAIGRKNWLFSDAVDGAHASAMFFSLIETAKANGFEPFDYLNRMLEKLPSAKTVDDFEKLLPLKGLFQG